MQGNVSEWWVSSDDSLASGSYCDSQIDSIRLYGLVGKAPTEVAVTVEVRLERLIADRRRNLRSLPGDTSLRTP